MGFFSKLGIILLILIALIPIFFCLSNLGEANKYIQTSEIEKVQLNGTFEFFNPVLTFAKVNIVKSTDFFLEKISRVIGLRTISGNIQCTKFSYYLTVGVFLALWLYLFRLLFNKGYITSKFFSSGQLVSNTNRSNILGSSGNSTLQFGGFTYNSSPGERYINFLAGNFFRLLIVALTYTYIMSFIPILNRIISIVTLEIFQPNWFIQSLIIAFEIGLLPAMIEEYNHYNAKMKVYKKVLAKKTYEKATEAWFKG